MANLEYDIEEKKSKPQTGLTPSGEKRVKLLTWIFLLGIALIIAGVIVSEVTGQPILGGDGVAKTEYVERTAPEIISEIEGFQSVMQAYKSEKGSFPVKTEITKLQDMKKDVSGLAGYDDFRLSSFDKKPILYESNAEGTGYVIFAKLPDGSKEIKSKAPTGFIMPKDYNYWVTNPKGKK